MALEDIGAVTLNNLAWRIATETDDFPQGSARALELAERRRSVDDLQLVDVRNPGEVALGSIEGALPIPVGQLPGRLDELDSARPTVVFCAGGYRSSVAASVLRRSGFHDVSDVLRGFGAWRNLADASVH